MKWSFFEAWNTSIEANKSTRILEPRDYIWASELGSAFIDRYYKMQGIEPTNPPDYRARRKFEAGNIWEWMIGLVLRRAGILVSSQTHITHQYDGLLKVTGREDFRAGGNPDWDKAKDEVTNGDYPDIIKYSAGQVISSLSQKFPQGLDLIPLEIKSTSQYMFEKYVEWQACDPKHRLQLFHYLKGTDTDEGHVVYICRDDCRMLEIAIYNPGPAEMEYKRDIEEMTHYVLDNVEPDKEKEVVFMEDTFRFAANWKVEYSNYLYKIYGYKDPMEFRERWSGKNGQGGSVGSWNRVFKRIVNGDKLTALNLAVIDEIKANGFELDYLVEKAKAQKIQLGGEDDGNRSSDENRGGIV